MCPSVCLSACVFVHVRHVCVPTIAFITISWLEGKGLLFWGGGGLLLATNRSAQIIVCVYVHLLMGVCVCVSTKAHTL